MKTYFVLTTALILSVFGSPANAQPPAGSSNCHLNFEVKGTDIQILVGYSRLKGKGVIACVDSNGVSTSTNMKVTIGTPVLFPRISFAPSLTVRGAADQIRILKGGPQVIFGKYMTLDIRVAVGGGVGTSLDLEGEDNGLTINLGLLDVEGFGLAAGGTIVTFEAL